MAEHEEEAGSSGDEPHLIRIRREAERILPLLRTGGLGPPPGTVR